MNLVYLSLHKEVSHRNYWDYEFANDLLGYEFKKHDQIEEGMEGAVVLIPARHHIKDANEINKLLKPLKWCLVMLMGDEASLFPWEALNHPNMRLWIMHPRPDRDYPKGTRFLINSYSPDTKLLKGFRKEFEEKKLDWFFAGQVSHVRREEAFEELTKIPNGEFHASPGFTQGLDHKDYFRGLASAKIAPCPSGPETPDSFRLYESLEAGCIPIVEEKPARKGYPGGFWNNLLGEVPFPIVADWTSAKDLIPELLEDWQTKSNVIFSWWMGFKRKVRHNLETDLHHLCGYEKSKSVTVLMPSSPIPAHPSTEMINETIKSVQERIDAEIIVTLDGVRSEQEERKPVYGEYRRKFLWECNWEFENVLPVVFTEHSHQSGMAKAVIDKVRTPYLMYVEHDTPLNGDIDFKEVLGAIKGEINLIRFHHETKVGDYHKHLMLDDHATKINGAPLIRTVQWSSRPNIAKTEFYRWLLVEFVGKEAKTMIEFIMLGLINHAYEQDGYAGWARFGMALYAPNEEFMQHSINLNGRQEDPMYPTTFAYDGDVPPGAPEPK